MAGTLTIATLLLYLALSGYFGNQPAPIVFLLPIAFSAYLGGLGPGLFSTALSVLAADYFIAFPVRTFEIENPVDLVRLTTLLLVGVLVSILSESLHRAQRNLLPPAGGTFALERRARVGFAIGLLALVFTGGMSYRSVARMRDDAEWVDHTHQVISSVRQLLLSLTEAETIQRGFMISGSETFLRPYDAALRDVTDKLRELRISTIDNPAQQHRLDELDPLVAERISYFQEVAELRRAQGPEAAQALIATGRGRAIRERIHAVVSDMEDLENAELKDRAVRAQRSTVTAKLIIVAASALALGFTLVGLFLLGQDFARSRRAEQELREFAGQLESRVKDRTAELLLANASLKASEELQSVTLASIGDGVITTDGDGRVTFLNGEAERLTGWKIHEAWREELAKVFHIVNEDTRAPVEDPSARVLRSGKAVALANHTILVSRDGKETPIADSAAPITDINGAVRGVVLVFRDCTAQRNAEKSLRERVALQEQLEKVAASAPVVICSFQLWPDGRNCFPYASPSIENVYGVPPQELAKDGSPVFKMIHPEDAERVQKSIAESAANLTPWRDEFRIVGPDGAVKWIAGHSMPQRQEDGSILWHGVIGDITESKLQQEKLHASQDQFRMLVAGVKDYAIIMLDVDGNVTTWNQGAERIKGWRAEEIVGQHFSRFYTEADVADGKPQRELEIARAEDRFEEEGWRVRKDSSRFWASVVITPLRNDKGSEYGFAKITRDMSAQRGVERAMKDKEARLAGVIASAMDAIITTDEKQRITLFNQAAESMFGFQTSEILGQPLETLIPSRFRGSHAGHMNAFGKASVVRRKMSEARPIYGLRRNGEEFPIEASISHVEVSGQKLFTVIMRDMTEKMQAAEARERLAAIVESSDDAIISKTLDGTIIAWNHGAEKIFGYSSSEAIGEKVWMLIPQARENEEFGILARIARGESVEHFETKRIRKDGVTIDVSVTISPIRDSTGAVVGASKIARDISEKKLVESVLRDSEERLRLAVDGARLGTWRRDLRTKEVTFSPRCKSLFGLPPDAKLSFEVFLATIHAEDRARVQDTVQRTLDGHPDYDAEYRILWPDGSIHWIAARGCGYYDDAGQALSMEGIAMDVTESRNAIDRLLESEERFEAMANSIPQLAWMAEADGHIIWYNQRWYDYTGKTFEQMQGWGWQSVHDPEVLPQVLTKWKAAIANGDLFNMEFPLRGADGHFRMFLTKVRPLKDANGRVTRWFGTNTDITDLKKAQATQHSAQKLESLGTLSGGIAHDFNNILLAINGNTNLAISDLPPDHPAQESLKEIAKAGARASDLVRRILAFTRPGEQKREVRRMQPVVEEAVKLVRATLPANIEIKTHLPANLPPVTVDATQIHQVIVNLATNGAHAIGNRPGIIDLRLDTAEIGADDTGRAPGLQPGRYVKLYVGDNGCGMDSNTLARIYDPFFTTKPVGQGTGLGLSVVHGIVSSHDGAVTVYSEPGKGTAFHLYFPATTQPETSRAPETPQIERGRSEHVMYVDDEEALVFFAKRMLTKLGYRVTGHTDAAEALQEFRANPADFDAVVTDMSMPRMSGLEFTREVLAIRPGTTVVITSGYLRPEDQAKAEELGVRAVILKPTTADQLAKKLDQLLHENADAGQSKVKS